MFKLVHVAFPVEVEQISEMRYVVRESGSDIRVYRGRERAIAHYHRIVQWHLKSFNRRIGAE